VPALPGTLGWLRIEEPLRGPAGRTGGGGGVEEATSARSRATWSDRGFAPGTPRWRVFGDVTAVPTLFLFDGQGKTAGAYYGAPPDLHADAESRIRALTR
jgi:hypothetical protein